MSDSTVEIAIESWGPDNCPERVSGFLSRQAFSEEAETIAREMLADIRKRGDAAVAEFARKFDGLALAPCQWRVEKAELNLARETVDTVFVNAAREARRTFDPSVSLPIDCQVGRRLAVADSTSATRARTMPCRAVPIQTMSLLSTITERAMFSGRPVACVVM